MKVAKPILFTLAMAVAAPLVAQPAIMPPPPPAPMPPAPPPPVMIRSISPQKPLPVVTFQIEVWGGTEKLWAGPLRVGGYNSASYNSSVSEAAETCPADKSGQGTYAPGINRSIRLSLSRRGYTEQEPQFSVSANWTRPGVPCEEGGSSSVSFDRPFKLEPGEKAEFKGDGGLIVRVSRVK